MFSQLGKRILAKRQRANQPSSPKKNRGRKERTRHQRAKKSTRSRFIAPLHRHDFPTLATPKPSAADHTLSRRSRRHPKTAALINTVSPQLSSANAIRKKPDQPNKDSQPPVCSRNYLALRFVAPQVPLTPANEAPRARAAFSGACREEKPGSRGDDKHR